MEVVSLTYSLTNFGPTLDFGYSITIKVRHIGVDLIEITSLSLSNLLAFANSPFISTLSPLQALDACDLVLNNLTAHMYLSTLN